MISLLSKLNLDPPIQECGWYHAAHVSTLTGWDSQIEERNCEKQSEYCCSFEGARLTYHALEIQKTPNKHSTSNGAMGEAETAGLSAHDKTKENNIPNNNGFAWRVLRGWARTRRDTLQGDVPLH